MTIDWAALTALIAVIGSGVTIFLAWRKAPIESANLRAETDAHISEIALTLIKPMKQRIDELETSGERQRISINELEKRITELESELRKERSEKAEIAEGAHRLVHQVESLGASPVYRPPAKRGTGELKKP